jgi:glycosyltransferase involved in cell wall biosynthesis
MPRTMSPLVSIIVPCHNAAPWLAQTLESALAQTGVAAEIIVVDDGSADESPQIARRFEARGVRTQTQPNRGASAARNAGLRLAKGEFLQFLDADDLLDPHKIRRQLDLAAHADPGAVLCCAWNRFTDAPTDAGAPLEVLCRDADPVSWVVAKFEQNAMMHPAAWLVPRALAEVAGPWDESLSLDDDGEYFTRVVLASRGVRFCPEARTYYRSGLPGSLSREKSERAWESAYRSLRLSGTRLLGAEDSPRTRGAYATALQHFIYDAYPRAAACRREAAGQIRALGGARLRPPGGPKFQLARRVLGWRLAKRLAALRS